MSVTRLEPPIELNTPKGRAVCHFLAYNGAEGNTLWGCFQDDGQILVVAEYGGEGGAQFQHVPRRS